MLGVDFVVRENPGARRAPAWPFIPLGAAALQGRGGKRLSGWALFWKPGSGATGPAGKRRVAGAAATPSDGGLRQTDGSWPTGAGRRDA